MKRNRSPKVELPGRPARLLDVALRIVVFTLLWWLLTQGDLDSWVLGAPTVALAILISLHMLPAGDWHWAFSPYGAFRFALYFLRKSMLSSVDVAIRVMHPAMPLKPGLFEYHYRITGENARVIMANTTSLLPGTLSVDLVDDKLLVHVLDLDAPIEAELRLLEKRIAAIYGIKLEG